MSNRIVRLVAAVALVGAVGAVAAFAQSSLPSSINPASPEVLQAVRSFHEYSRKAPVRVDTVRKDERPGYTLHKLVFTATVPPRVPALLAIPKSGTAPFPVVVLMRPTKCCWASRPSPARPRKRSWPR